MSYSVDRFKTLIEAVGLSQGNRYTVNVPVLSEDQNLLACNVTLGVPTIQTFDYQNVNPQLKLPGNVLYTPLVIEFYVLENNEPYKTLLNWVQNAKTSDFHLNDFDTLATGQNIIVTEFHRQGQQIGQYTYYNAYPTEVSGKTLGYDNTSAALKFGCTFVYEYMDNQ